MKHFILGIITAGILGGGAYYLYQFNLQPQTVQQNGLVTTATPLPSPATPLVGGDRDEHGCIGSAGYTWCESKQKCYRAFEEGCQTLQDNDLIRDALFVKNKWQETDGITVTVQTNDGTYASGQVTAQGGGGYFYAIKENGEWKIVADGNGIIPCDALKDYPDYPNTLISGCYDETTQKVVKR